MEEHLNDVYREIASLAGKWKNMYSALRIQPPDTARIAAAYHNNPDVCLRAVLLEWLQKSYECQIYGPPTWRMLVKAVAEPAGGDNIILAESIARRHQGIST